MKRTIHQRGRGQYSPLKVAGVVLAILLAVGALAFFVWFHGLPLTLKKGSPDAFTHVQSYNATTYVYYDFSSVLAHEQFDTLRSVITSKHRAPVSDLILNNNREEPYLSPSSFANNSVRDMLIAVSPHDPLYAFIDENTRMAQAFYMLNTSESFNAAHFKEEKTLVRYVFVMDADQAQRAYQRNHERSFIERYGKEVVAKSGIRNGFFVFVADLPAHRAHEVLLDQGGVR